MNTNSNRRPVSIAIALTAAASVITVITAGTATAGIASEPRGSTVTSDSVSIDGSFGEPLAALGGQSLAEYLADHWEPVVAAGV
jgi:hypothetical protein